MGQGLSTWYQKSLASTLPFLQNFAEQFMLFFFPLTFLIVIFYFKIQALWHRDFLLVISMSSQENPDIYWHIRQYNTNNSASLDLWKRKITCSPFVTLLITADSLVASGTLVHAINEWITIKYIFCDMWCLRFPMLSYNIVGTQHMEGKKQWGQIHIHIHAFICI